MLRLTNIRVRTLSLKSHQVAWEIVPTPEEALDYRFQVLRSEAQAGPWNALTDWFVDKYLFLDNSVPPYHLHRTLFYIIRVKHAVSGATEDFGPVSREDEPDMLALDVRRHWDVKLREYVGRRSWLFPVRTFGTTCKNCYSPQEGLSQNSQCKSCYATGFVRGFHTPMEIWAQFNPTPKNLQLTADIRQESATVVLLPAFPETKPKDLIVSPDNRRWRVASVKRTERLGAPLHQEITVAECAPGDIEFQVPVNVDELMSLPLAGERNFRYRTTIG